MSGLNGNKKWQRVVEVRHCGLRVRGATSARVRAAAAAKLNPNGTNAIGDFNVGVGLRRDDPLDDDDHVSNHSGQNLHINQVMANVTNCAIYWWHS